MHHSRSSDLCGLQGVILLTHIYTIRRVAEDRRLLVILPVRTAGHITSVRSTDTSKFVIMTIGCSNAGDMQPSLLKRCDDGLSPPLASRPGDYEHFKSGDRNDLF
jgi:hypothetical protein